MNKLWGQVWIGRRCRWQKLTSFNRNNTELRPITWYIPPPICLHGYRTNNQMQGAKVSKRAWKRTIFYGFRLPSIQTAFGGNLNKYMLSARKRYIRIDTVTYRSDSPSENLVHLPFLTSYNRGNGLEWCLLLQWKMSEMISSISWGKVELVEKYFSSFKIVYNPAAVFCTRILVIYTIPGPYTSRLGTLP